MHLGRDSRWVSFWIIYGLRIRTQVILILREGLPWYSTSSLDISGSCSCFNFFQNMIYIIYIWYTSYIVCQDAHNRFVFLLLMPRGESPSGARTLPCRRFRWHPKLYHSVWVIQSPVGRSFIGRMIDFYNPRCPLKRVTGWWCWSLRLFFCFATFFQWILVGVNSLRCNQVGIENDHILYSSLLHFFLLPKRCL